MTKHSCRAFADLGLTPDTGHRHLTATRTVPPPATPRRETGRNTADVTSETWSRMTPAERLALLERSFAAWNPPDIEAIIGLYQPDCEWRMGHMAAAFGTEVFRGHDGLRALVAAIEEGFESYNAERYETRITSDGALVTRGEIRVRSSGTGIELSTPTFWRGEFRDDLILLSEILDGPPPGWDEATPIS
jgi:ketosteroid isomerase-like protein